MKIAVVGSGISGLAAAWALTKSGHQVTVYEKEGRIGGHTNTIHLEGIGPVDTGFIVFNHVTYPNMINFFKHLGVQYMDSNMSFSVNVDHGTFEWAGEGLQTVFAQKSNLFSPSFLRMLYDINRFNSEAPKFLNETDERKLTMTIGEYLDKHGYSQAFRDGYFLPMTAAIWSTPTAEMLNFPAITLIRFCHNHHLLQIANRPQWLTVKNGSYEYVKVIQETVKDIRVNCGVASVRRDQESSQIHLKDSQGNQEIYDHIIFACHGDQTFKLLEDLSNDEKRILGRIQYKKNRAVVHYDPRFMPKRKITWSSWNYQSFSKSKATEAVSLTYWMNRLQGFIPKSKDVFVTLNPLFEPKKDLYVTEFMYEHPVYTLQTMQSQNELPSIQGKQNTWFAGAWTNFGFHEDGLTSGFKVALALGAKIPFPVIDATHIRAPPSSKL